MGKKIIEMSLFLHVEIKKKILFALLFDELNVELLRIKSTDVYYYCKVSILFS